MKTIFFIAVSEGAPRGFEPKALRLRSADPDQSGITVFVDAARPRCRSRLVRGIRRRSLPEEFARGIRRGICRRNLPEEVTEEFAGGVRRRNSPDEFAG